MLYITKVVVYLCKQNNNTMKELFNFYVSMYSRMNTFEQVVLGFWGVCIVLFTIVYLKGLFVVLQDKFKRKPKPQRF